MILPNALHTSIRILYKSIAIFLVVFAVLLSCLRLFLPYAHNFREDVQSYINSTYQTNVIIGQLTSGWANKGPTLLIKNVSLLNARGIEVFIGNLEVEVDFWKSLRYRQLITTNFIIDNAKVFIEPNKFEKSKRNAGDRVILDQLSNLFLTQIPRFMITDSQVKIMVANKIQILSIPELAWLNKGKHHKGKGEVIVNDLSNHKLKLLVDLVGDEKTELNGQAYFEADNINITPWLNDFIVVDNNKTDSAINFQTWLQISQGKAKQLIVQLGDNHIDWQHQNQEQKLALSNGYFVVEASDNYDYLGFYSSPIYWQVNDKPKQVLDFNASLAYGGISGYVSSLDIESVTALKPLFIEQQETQEQLASIGATGQLHDIHFRFYDQLKLVTNFSDIETQPYLKIPGIKNVSGQLAYQQKQALLSVTAQNGEIKFNELFKRPIPYQQLSADIMLDFQQGVLAKVSDISLVSEELTLDANVVISAPVDEKASMALLAYVEKGQAKFAKHYYPHLLMGDNLVNYLERAITDGELNQTEIIFDGRFSDFPFTDKPGLFMVDAQISGSNFVFDSHWPVIENLNANLNFTNNSMLITAHSGSLTGLNVENVEVAIADLSYEQVLTVSANINEQNPKHVTALMNSSSLANSVGKVLNITVLEQPISGEFSLNLPLKNSERAVAKGSINFKNNELYLQSPNMHFSNLYGKLTFNNDVVKVKELRANWRGMPITFKVDGQNNKSAYKTDISFNGLWQQDNWQLEIPASLQKYLLGKLNWQADLTLNSPHQGEFSYQLALTTDLTNNTIQLPAPYHKLTAEPAKLFATIQGSEEHSIIQASLNDNLSFNGELVHQSASFKNSHLVLGTEKLMQPINGFYISAVLDTISVEQWQPFISDIFTSLPKGQASASSTNIIEQPERIQGTIKVLSAFDEQFNDVSFNVLDKDNWWLMELNAKEVRSQVKIYPDWENQGIDINLDFLKIAEKNTPSVIDDLTNDLTNDLANDGGNNLAALEKTVKTRIIDHQKNQQLFASIPAIKFNCDSCQIGRFDFGKLEFNVVKEKNDSLLLKNLSVKRKGLDINLAGKWLMTDNYSTSQLRGDVNIKKIEAEMDKLGLASIIKDSGGVLKFDINWLGSLQDFSATTLNGETHIVIDDGYLADVSDQARIFSVLSLQSLVRKLTLDFRDMFSDGMFYSEIKGDTTIKKGIMYTDNIKMEGSAGDLAIKGNTNLVEGTLDYRMSYKPNLTSSLPVLGWIATLNPVAIIAGVAIDEVITSKVVSEFTFELTGTIDNPDLKEVNRKNENISVGRSTPPKIIEQEKTEEGNETPITPLKQYAPIYENKDG